MLPVCVTSSSTTDKSEFFRSRQIFCQKEKHPSVTLSFSSQNLRSWFTLQSSLMTMFKIFLASLLLVGQQHSLATDFLNACFLSQVPNVQSNLQNSPASLKFPQRQGLVAQRTFSFPVGVPVSPGKHLSQHQHRPQAQSSPQSFPLPLQQPPINIDSSLAQFREISHNHIKGGGAPSIGGTRNIQSTTTTTTVVPPLPPPITDRPRTIYRRPASRTRQTDFNQLFLTHEQFVPQEQLVNRAELEAISHFETALEEAKKHGLYGLRTRSPPREVRVPVRAVSKVRPQFNSQFPVKTQSYSQLTPASRTELNQRGVEDFKESFGFDPTTKTTIGVQRADPLPPSLPPPPSLTQQLQSPRVPVQEQDQPTNQPQSLPQSPSISDNDQESDDGFGPSFNSFLSSPSNTITTGNSINLFLEWMQRQQLITNMRISPGVNFTVLLPNDDAVKQLPSTFLDVLEKNATRLREILFYHIIPEALSIDVLQNEDMIPTLLSRKDIRIAKNHHLMMSGAMVVTERKELELDSGKVRFIEVDRVLFPPVGSLYDVITRAPELGIFRRLIEETDLKTQLEQPVSSSLNGLTIFAPTDKAFQSLNAEAISLLTRDKAVARSLVLNHFAQPVIFASSLPVGTSSTAKNIGSGLELTITREESDLVRVNGLTILFADITATNGILHVIDHVII